MGPGFEPQPNHSTSKHPHFLRMLFFVYMPRPKRNGSWVRTPAESLNYLKASSSEDAFFVCAPTKTQRVLGSNPAESQLSVLIREQGVETWLEASTERSESNPGRSLGIYTAYSDSCLEDSTSPRPSIRCQSAFYVKFLIFFLF